MNPEEGRLDTMAAHKRALERKNNPIQVKDKQKRKPKEDSE